MAAFCDARKPTRRSWHLKAKASLSRKSVAAQVIAELVPQIKVAHVRLCHSRMFFILAYPRETQEMVFDAHDRAFAFFKGACARGIYDNMKTAVETPFTTIPRRA